MNTPQQFKERTQLKLKHIESGAFHSIGIDNEGRVHSWGLNDSGQLGLDDGAQQATTPQEVRGFGGMRIGLILARWNQSIGITSDEDHVMFNWGRWNGRRQRIKEVGRMSFLWNGSSSSSSNFNIVPPSKLNRFEIPWMK